MLWHQAYLIQDNDECQVSNQVIQWHSLIAETSSSWGENWTHCPKSLCRQHKLLKWKSKRRNKLLHSISVQWYYRYWEEKNRVIKTQYEQSDSGCSSWHWQIDPSAPMLDHAINDMDRGHVVHLHLLNMMFSLSFLTSGFHHQLFGLVYFQEWCPITIEVVTSDWLSQSPFLVLIWWQWALIPPEICLTNSSLWFVSTAPHF